MSGLVSAQKCGYVMMLSMLFSLPTSIGNEEINEEELLGEEEGEEEAMGDSEGEEIPEDGQEEGLCMDEEEGEIMDELAEDEEQFPDSNLDDEGNEFPEVCEYIFYLIRTKKI